MMNMDATIPEWKQKIHQNIQHFEKTIKDNPDKYPMLRRATTPISEPSGKIIGRDMYDFKQALKNPEKANVILLGDAGSGKTAFIQGFAYHEDSTAYLVLSTNIERLIDEDDLDKDSGLSNGLSDLFAEVKRYSIEEDIILVMFIDEFHRIAMLSPSAVESMKPTLEHSARNGYRIVAATTFEEYDQWISGNRALDQRFLRISLPELGREAVIKILKNRAEDYGLADQAEENIYDEIYHQSKHILISNSQPRASIDMLMSMIGNAVKSEKMIDGKLQRVYATPEDLDIPGDKILSRQLLHRYIRRAYGIDIDNKIHVSHVRKTLETKIYNQDQAVRLVMQLLERMLVGFSDPSRPKISFLSTGPTGVGKTELAKQASEALGIPLKRFDMSRYSRPEDAIRFADELAAAAWSAPNAYILIDEAEKSTKEAMNILLQVLDDARLTAANNPNRVISFTGNIINLTTNLGSETYQHMKRFGENDRDVDIEVIYRSLADSDEFETAVLGRLDAIVPFVGLPDSAMNKIAMSELERQIPVVETARRQFFVSPDVVPFVVLDKTSSNTERGGARDIKRNINDLVLGRIASYLATNPDEVPVIVLLEGRPRFKNADVGDPDSAHITLVECHPHILVDSWVTAVGNKLDTIFHNDGLFIPKSWDINQFAKEVLYLARNGVRRLTTEVDGETVTIEDSTGRYKRS